VPTDESTPIQVFFATHAGLPELTDDDRILASALARRGVLARAAAWDDPLVDWTAARAVILRSTWNYFLRRDDFLAWTERTAAHSIVHNSPSVIRWNSHKGYLAELASRGIPVIDTVLAPADASIDLASVARAHHWGEIVVKPAVSAAAHGTRRFHAHERAKAQAHLESLLASGDALIQPYMGPLEEQGELSMIFVAERFTHAVRRRSALARVDAMPKTAVAEAPTSAVHFAERAIEAGYGAMRRDAPNTSALYARVDLAEIGTDEYLLLELELIEPSLFFRHAPDAAERLAEAIVRGLSS
jgi:hypothetical protein